jgi:hypothetical protein
MAPRVVRVMAKSGEEAKQKAVRKYRGVVAISADPLYTVYSVRLASRKAGW